MQEITNATSLRKANGHMEVPFIIPFDKKDVLVCCRVLRLLPGKRLVALAEFKGREVIVKVFFKKGFAKKHFTREIKHYEHLQRTNVLIPELLLKAQYGDIYIIIFEKLQSIADLPRILQDENAQEERKALLIKMIQILAQVHDQGVCPNDLHANNFIQTKDQLYMIDMADMDFDKQSLSCKRGIKNLSLLLAQLIPQYDVLCESLLAHYLTLRSFGKVDKERLKLLKKYQQTYRLKREKHLLKKIFRSSAGLIQYRDFNNYWVCDREYYSPAVISLLSNPNQWIKQGEIIKAGNTCTVVKLKIDLNVFIIKRYNIKGFWHGVKRAFAKTRAATSWQNAYRLLSYGILTPKPVAIIEKHVGPIKKQAFYIAEFVEGELLDHVFKDYKDNEDISLLLYNKMSKLVRFLGQLGLSHGDLKGSNFIFKNTIPSSADIRKKIEEAKLYVMDLDSMRRYRFKRSLQNAVTQDLKRLMFRNFKQSTKRNWMC